MHHSVRRLLTTIMIVLAALFPAAAVAQTPEATPSEPPYIVGTIAVTRVGTVPIMTPVVGEAEGLVHAVMGLTIDPGASTPHLDVTLMYSLVLHVQEGTLRITASEGSARISAGSGTPVLYGTDGAETCEGNPCTLASGQSAILGPGNSLAAEEGLLQLEVVGDERTMTYVSILIPESSIVGSDLRDIRSTPVDIEDEPICWICPGYQQY